MHDLFLNYIDKTDINILGRDCFQDVVETSGGLHFHMSLWGMPTFRAQVHRGPAKQPAEVQREEGGALLGVLFSRKTLIQMNRHHFPPNNKAKQHKRTMIHAGFELDNQLDMFTRYQLISSVCFEECLRWFLQGLLLVLRETLASESHLSPQ